MALRKAGDNRKSDMDEFLSANIRKLWGTKDTKCKVNPYAAL